MRKLVKWIIAVIIYYSGALYLYKRFLKPRLVKNNLIILRYHRILEKDKADSANISVVKESFEQQLQYIKRNFRVLSLSEIIEKLTKYGRFLKPTLGITFDDGYKSNYTYAYPLLRSYALPATIFLTVDYIDNHKTFPWDRQMPPQDVAMLSWKEIAEMKDNGISFGTHTLTHPQLDRISLVQAKNEIFESGRILAEKLGKQTDLFSYPHGCFNSQIKKLVKQAGYKAAFITKEGFLSKAVDLYTLRRKAIHQNLVTNPFGRFSRSLFAVEIEGVFDLLLPNRRVDFDG